MSSWHLYTTWQYVVVHLYKLSFKQMLDSILYISIYHESNCFFFVYFYSHEVPWRILHPKRICLSHTVYSIKILQKLSMGVTKSYTSKLIFFFMYMILLSNAVICKRCLMKHIIVEHSFILGKCTNTENFLFVERLQKMFYHLSVMAACPRKSPISEH